jgi:hypothetical protein
MEESSMMKRLVAGLVVSLVVALPVQALVKDSAVKPVAKSARAVSKAGVVSPVHDAQPPAALSSEQLAIADKVLLGTSQCEFSVVVTMRADARTAGRFVLEAARKRYLLDPVVTSTGAVRLEEVSSGAVWLQLANKSMLMNQKLGQRIADDCMNPQQQLVAQALLRTPATHLLDAPKDAPEPLVSDKVAQEMVPILSNR